MKDLIDQLYPGVDPDFFTDDDMSLGQYERMTPEQRTCVFCRRHDNQTEGMVYGASAGRAICTDCIEACDMVRREHDPKLREAWYLKRGHEWEKRVIREDVKHPPPPHRRKRSAP